MGARLLRGVREHLRPDTLLIQMYSLMVALAFGLALVVLMGNDDRFSGPAFRGARGLVAWSGIRPDIAWGLMFAALTLALVISIGRAWSIHVLRFGTVVYFFMSVGFIASAIQEPTAALTGAVAYTIFGIAHALLSVHIEVHGWSGDM